MKSEFKLLCTNSAALILPRVKHNWSTIVQYIEYTWSAQHKHKFLFCAFTKYVDMQKKRNYLVCTYSFSSSFKPMLCTARHSRFSTNGGRSIIFLFSSYLVQCMPLIREVKDSCWIFLLFIVSIQDIKERRDLYYPWFRSFIIKCDFKIITEVDYIYAGQKEKNTCAPSIIH